MDTRVLLHLLNELVKNKKDVSLTKHFITFLQLLYEIK